MPVLRTAFRNFFRLRKLYFAFLLVLLLYANPLTVRGFTILCIFCISELLAMLRHTDILISVVQYVK